MMKNTKLLLGTPMKTATVLFAMTAVANAAVVFEYNFNDADGLQTNDALVPVATTGGFNAGVSFSSTSAPSNSGGFSGDFSTASGGQINFGDVDAADSLSQVTLSAWVRVGSDATAANFRFLQKGANDFIQITSGNNRLRLKVGGGAVVDSSAVSITRDEWTFIAASYDSASGDVTFYKQTESDLALVSETVSGTSGLTFAGNVASVLMGSTNSAISYQGLLDNVRIHDSVLSGAEVSALYATSDVSAIPEPASIALWIGVIGLGVSTAYRKRR